MTDRTQLEWYVPVEVDEAHAAYAASEYGEADGSRGRAAEDAMCEFMDRDAYAPVEAEADAILAALPDADTGGAKKTDQDPPDGHPVGGPTRKIRVYVAAELEADFRTFAREDLDVSPGVAMSHALWEQAGSGRNRAQRLADKLAAIRESVEADAATGEDKPAALAAQLDRGFTLEQFTDAAAAVGVTTEKYAIEKFLPEVLDEKDAVPHPRTPEVFAPADSEVAPEHPNPAALPYYAQTDADQRIGLQVAAVRKAWRNGGRARLTVQEGIDALSGVGSPRHKTVRARMQAADDRDDGFDYDPDGPALRMRIPEVAATHVLDIAAEEHGRETGSGDAGLEDATPGVEGGEPPAQDGVDAEMDRLTEQAIRGDGNGR